MSRIFPAGETRTQPTVFFIAYHYPPIHSAGVERTVKFLRYLPEFGYRAKVLTTAAFGGGGEEWVLRAWEPLGLYRWLFNPAARAGQVDSSARTASWLFSRVVKPLCRLVLIPDGQVTWLPAALMRSLVSFLREPPAILYSTYPPASGHLLGLGLKKLTRLPWVADFRDSWIYDPLDPALQEMPCRWALEKGLEKAVLKGADAVVATTEISADYLRQACPEAASRILVIPNGFDPEDFAAAGSGKPPSCQDPLRLVHTGSFSRSHPRRTPQPLFTALEALCAEDPVWARRLRLILVGALTQAEQQAAARLEAAGMVEVRGVVERSAALACQQQAHILLLLDHSRDWPSSNIPGKFYEYLAVRRPILALSGAGMVERMIRQLGAGFQAPADDPVAIRRILVEIYQRFHRGELAIPVDEEALRRFHRRELTRQLARCFDVLLGIRKGGCYGG